MPVQRVPSTGTRAILFLLALTAVALSPVLFADFIRLDDYGHLFQNPELRRMSPVGVWSKPYFNLYIPITYSIWWVLATVGRSFGDLAHEAWMFHGFNLAIHLVNATLVFRIVRTLLHVDRPNAAPDDLLENTIALVSALLFSLHPVQVESVAWISELRGELAALFGFLGLWLHCRSRKRLVVALLFVTAMLAKPSAIVLPPIVFLIDRIVRGKPLAKSAGLALLYGAPLLVLAIVTKHLQRDSEQDFIPSVGQRLVVAADAIAFYVSKVVLPHALAVDYGRTPQAVLREASRLRLAVAALLSLLAAGVVVTAVVRPPGSAQPAHETTQQGRGRSLVWCGLSTFVVSLLPVLGFVPFAFQNLSTVADHYLYVPMFGVGLFAAGVLVRLRTATNVRRVAAAPLVVLAVLSARQAWRWRSTEPLFAYTLTVNPRSYVSAFCLGDELMRSGRLDEATVWLERALTQKPDYLDAVLTLGMVFTKEGQQARAIDLYKETLAKIPATGGTRAKHVASVHNNLGMLFLQAGQIQKGMEHLRAAVDIFPRSLNAHLNLGNVAFNQGRYADAVAEYQFALSLSPESRAIERRLDQARQRAEQP